MLTRASYRLEKPILHSNLYAQSLNGQLILPANVAKVGGQRRIIAGSFLTNGNRLLPRAKLISPYTSGSPQIIVNNPSVFKVGDVLRVIGTPSSTKQQEAAAVSGGTATLFGTVAAIDNNFDLQITTVTPNSVAVGNIFTIQIEGVSISYTATTTSNQDVVNGLRDAFSKTISQSSLLADLRVDVTSTQLTIRSSYPREIFTVTGTVAQGTAGTTGTLAVAVTQAVGAITITPQAGNGNQIIGTKLGTITDIPLGVIANEFYLTDDDGIDRECQVAAYDQAAIYAAALPYLDGDIMQQLPRLSFV